MTLSRTQENYLLLGIMLLAVVFMGLSIQNGHDWGDDFALYIEQTKALTNGSIFRLYATNKFAMQYSSELVGPYLYPNGFPLLLSPLYYCFGLHFIAMKAFCSLFFIAAIPIVFSLVKPYFTNSIYPFLIILAFVFHISFVSFSDQILSDFPFFFFSFLSLLLMKSQHTFLNQLALGFCIFFTYFVRDIGIVLLPTLLVYQLWQYFSKVNQRDNKWLLLIPYVVFFMLFALVAITLPKGGENHITLLLTHVSLRSIGLNGFYYLRLLSTYFFFKNYWLFVPVLLVVLVGWYQSIKRATQFIAFASFFSLVLIIWPGVQGIRFIFPLIPFVLFFLVKGAMFLSEKFKIQVNYLQVILLLFVLRTTLYTIKQTVFVKQESSNHSYTIEMQDIYQFIANNIPEKAIVGFLKPRALRLFTGRNAIKSNPKHFDASVATYFLIEKKNADSSINKYQKLYETKNYILVSKAL
jgi:hypothetical protein